MISALIYVRRKSMPSSTINTKSAVAAIKSAAAEGTPIQEITNLTITPGPNSVSFSFQTLFASSALIEIFAYKTGDPNKDIQPTNLVTSNAAQLPGASRKKKNQYRLPEPDSFTPTFFPGFSDTLTTPLNQDSHFWFRITADSTISGVVPAVTIGRFWTAQRNVIATVDELLVYSY